MGKEVIIVNRVGPYGVYANDQWYGIGKSAEFAASDFEKGRSYTVVTNTAQSGKKYINDMSPADNADYPSQPPAPVQGLGAPLPSRIPFTATEPKGKTWGSGNDDQLQERIARNTAYQKATDAVSRLLTPFIAKEEDIVPKLQKYVEEMAAFLFPRIKGMVPA